MGKIWFIILLLLLLLVFLIVFLSEPVKGEESYSDLFLKAQNYIPLDIYPKLSGNSFLIANNEQWEGSKEWVRNLIITKSLKQGVNPDLALEIVRRESNFNPKICNWKFGCRSGMGLFQIVLGTLKHCQSKLGRLLDAFDPIDNIDCGIWLLKYEGIGHWEPYSGPYFQ
ncbi:MAG: transglycosylase SLT domain-containing protein [Nanoarchaeota archaeon]